MTDQEDEYDGYDAEDWTRLVAFTRAVATQEDVEARRAVFALTDTDRPIPLDMPLPQPVIWWEEDGEQAAVAIQAEEHTTPGGEVMQVLGLILPDGDSALVLIDDVDLVDATDPTWRSLVEKAVE